LGVFLQAEALFDKFVEPGIHAANVVLVIFVKLFQQFRSKSHLPTPEPAEATTFAKHPVGGDWNIQLLLIAGKKICDGLLVAVSGLSI
jgi:hypothetical protein